MPEARISPKVIFIGRMKAGIPHDSADRASREAARMGLGRDRLPSVADLEKPASELGRIFTR